MATTYFGVNLGASSNPNVVSVGTVAPSTDIYVAVVGTNSPSRLGVQLAVDAIMLKINEGSLNPNLPL